METTASLIILTPVLLPLMQQIGVDPLHFGVILVLNLVIGLTTPPVGVCLFIACSIGQTKRLFDQPCLMAQWVFDRNKVVGDKRNSHLPTMMILENIFENSLPTVFHQCKEGVNPVDKGAIK